MTAAHYKGGHPPGNDLGLHYTALPPIVASCPYSDQLLVTRKFWSPGANRPSQVSEAWSAWWTRNGRVRQFLAALTNDAAGVRSEDGAPEISRSLASPEEAGEILAAYKRLCQLLRRRSRNRCNSVMRNSSATAMMSSRNCVSTI